MNIVIDESVDRGIVIRLMSDGYAVVDIAELKRGMSDSEVLDLANSKSSILVTADKDFGELIFRQGRIHKGVVLIRLDGLSIFEKAEMVASAFAKHSLGMINAFSVISETFVRIRKEPTSA